MREITDGQPLLFAVGINHKTALLEVREKLFIRDDEMPSFLNKLAETLRETIVLSTCNRTEIYGVLESSAVDLDFYKNLLIEFKKAGNSVKSAEFFSVVSCAACQQIFQVASSIDSKIIGDDQILQQLRDAYQMAKSGGFTGKVLNQLAQRAFKIGKKTYSETMIHRGAVSVGLAAVETAVEKFGLLGEKTALIVGAGEMARLTAEFLTQRHIGKIYLTNRTREKAAAVAENLQDKIVVETVEFEDFKHLIGQTDIIISSTSSADYILNEADFADLQRETLVIDIAVPRDVQPEVTNNAKVILKNIDDLNQIIDRNFSRRMAEIPAVKKIIAREMGDFLMWYYALPLLPKSKGNTAEYAEVKRFLAENVGLFHKLARQSKGEMQDDLRIHFDLVEKLQTLHYQAKQGVAKN